VNAAFKQLSAVQKKHVMKRKRPVVRSVHFRH